MVLTVTEVNRAGIVVSVLCALLSLVALMVSGKAAEEAVDARRAAESCSCVVEHTCLGPSYLAYPDAWSVPHAGVPHPADPGWYSGRGISATSPPHAWMPP